MNPAKQRFKKVGAFFGSIILVICVALGIGKLQVHAVAYIYNISEMANYINENGGSCEITSSNSIKLTSDFTSENYMFISLNSSDVTLDLNNHSMTFNYSRGMAIYGSSYTFSIINSGGDKTKAIISTTGNYANNQEICTFKASGKAKISNVTIKNSATGGTGNPLAIQQSVKGSELIMNNCRIESTGSCLTAIYGNTSLINCVAATNSSFSTILLENQGNLNINGGTYQHTGEEAAVSVKGEATEGDAILKIKAGTFKGVTQALVVSGDRAVVTIEQGTFSVSSSKGTPINVLDKDSSISYCYNSSIYTVVKNANSVKVVPKVEIAKLKISKIIVGRKKITVKISKKASAYGGQAYQIAYRLKGKKAWKYLNTSANSKTIKALKKNKKYQIKVRAYKVINGTKHYSQWSPVKTSAKVKK